MKEQIFTFSQAGLSYPELLQLWDTYGLDHYRKLPLVIAGACGIYVYDINGRKIIDAASGFSAANLGHMHPAMKAVLQNYCRSLGNKEEIYRPGVIPNKVAHLPGLRFLEAITGAFGYDKFVPANTGLEAVETAIKLALKWAYTKRERRVRLNKARIVVAENGFHGRSGRIIGLSSVSRYKKFFGPYAHDFGVTIPYGDAQALKDVLIDDAGRKGGSRIAAVLLEPIQGEAGIILPPDGYLRAVRELCTDFDVILIADEIQTGLGRAGYMLACNRDGIRPSMVLVGKSLGGGLLPISGVLLKKDYAVFEPGEHGSTFAGNPLSCTIATEVLEVLKRDDLCKASWDKGRYLRTQLESALLSGRSPSPHVAGIRGQALMQAIILKEGVDPWSMVLRLLDTGVLAIDAHHVIRIMPPLTITEKEIDDLVARIHKAFAPGHT